MATRVFMIALLTAVCLRLGLLVRNGYRGGRVKSAFPLSPYWDREKQPRVFWMTMGTHALVVVMLATCAIGIALGVLPISN